MAATILVLVLLAIFVFSIQRSNRPSARRGYKPDWRPFIQTNGKRVLVTIRKPSAEQRGKTLSIEIGEVQITSGNFDEEVAQLMAVATERAAMMRLLQEGQYRS